MESWRMHLQDFGSQVGLQGVHCTRWQSVINLNKIIYKKKIEKTITTFSK
jgi:hypothetical protein